MLKQVKVSNDIAEIIPRLFDGSVSTMVAEVIQNARRAGATVLECDKKENRIIICDNGRGMSLDDLESLITLRESKWEEDIQQKEDPAGMGFFSLYHANEITVVSLKDDKLSYLHGNKDSFKGAGFRVAPLEDQCGPEFLEREEISCGTVVEIRIDEQKLGDITHCLHLLAGWSGIPSVKVYGNYVEPSSFKIHADKRKERESDHNIVGVYESPEHGATVVVERVQAGSTVWDVSVNFYGIKLDLGGSLYRQLPPDYVVYIDVTSTEMFRMVLPARNAVASENAEEQAKFIRLCIYKMLKHSGEAHRLPFKFWYEAQQEGYDLRESTPLLLYAVSENKSEFVAPGFLLTAPNRCLAYTLQKLLGPEMLCYGDVEHSGYQWHAQLPAIHSDSVTVAGEKLSPDELAYELVEGTNFVITSSDILLSYNIDNVAHSNKLLFYVCSLSNYAWSTQSDLVYFLSPSVKTLHPEQLNELWHEIVESTYLMCSTSVDIYESQLEIEFRTAVHGKAYAQELILTKALNRAVAPLDIPKSSRLTLTYDRVFGVGFSRENDLKHASATAVLRGQWIDELKLYGGFFDRSYEYALPTYLSKEGMVVTAKDHLVFTPTTPLNAQGAWGLTYRLASRMGMEKQTTSEINGVWTSKHIE